ncbi:hypothetical protein FJ567_23705 [Mesorhizobium sp. B2-4-16]|nr:hypothetical protein FJ567_23705 [Mesorhizobium sp. B2-4-16]TPL70749.1 hypothetical protein FJ956_15135 [Mesorhizobium sp. B2-4-3]
MGGDQQLQRLAHSCSVEDWRKQRRRPISPQVGEMPGRAEGGRCPAGVSDFHLKPIARGRVSPCKAHCRRDPSAAR